MSVHVGARVNVGRSKRVHIIRPGTVYTRRGWFTTYCGYYANPDHGWMTPAIGEADCQRCVKASDRSQPAPPAAQEGER